MGEESGAEGNGAGSRWRSSVTCTHAFLDLAYVLAPLFDLRVRLRALCIKIAPDATYSVNSGHTAN